MDARDHRLFRQSLSGRLEHNEGLFAFLLVLPAMLIVLALYIYPLIYSFAISFLRSDIRYPEEFRGLKNYIEIFQEPDLLVSFWRTIYFTVVSLAIEMTRASPSRWPSTTAFSAGPWPAP